MIHDKQLNTSPEHYVNRDKPKPSKNVKAELVSNILIAILFTHRQFCPHIVEPYDAYESSGPDHLGSVHTYPEIFVSANFFMRIHLASTRVRRIRSVYPETKPLCQNYFNHVAFYKCNKLYMK